MFEKRHEPLISRPRFFRRMAVFLGAAVALDGAAVVAGAFGFHWLEQMVWLDSFLDASLLITGNGPVRQPQSVSGKVFAGLFAGQGVPQGTVRRAARSALWDPGIVKGQGSGTFRRQKQFRVDQTGGRIQETVVELGCGSGILLAALSRAGRPGDGHRLLLTDAAACAGKGAASRALHEVAANTEN